MTDSRRDDAARSYVLGHSERELERLQGQAGLFADLTRDILVRAGLSSGMRVLDIGCGVGDVSIIAADLVGPEGRVLGIDPAPEALSVARRRLTALGKHWVQFSSGTVEAVENGSQFDVAVGRFILIHLAKPADAVRNLMQSLRPGTIVVFVELDLSTAASQPPLHLLQQCVGWIGEVYRRSGRQLDMGTGLFSAFRAAGVTPAMIGLTRITSSKDQIGFDFLVESVRSLMPAMNKLGIATADDIDIDTLRSRLLAEAAAGDHCIFYPRLVGAWATVK
jgi:2-polyprenyl-3-methyl-5-hydroxy-6-metoxy-1,4-benzoquinol methylase